MNLSNATGNFSGKQAVCYEDEEIVRWSLITLALTLSAFAFAGNIFVIVLAAKYTIRKSLHHLIINMAAMDLCALIFYVLTWVPRLLNMSWNIQTVVLAKYIDICFAEMFLLAFFQGSSLVTLLIISIRRFKATQQTLQRPRPSTLKRRLFEVTCTYIASAVISTIMASSPKTFSQKQECEFVPGTIAMIHSLTYVTALSVTILLAFSLNIIVMRRISRQKPIEAQIAEAQRQVRAKRTGKVVKMVFCSLVLYFLCYIPLIALSVIHSILRSMNNLPGSLDLVGLCKSFEVTTVILAMFLPILNGFLSPFIYIAFLKDFQEAAKRIICRRTNTEDRRDRVELKN